jgi:hypothetical protein
MNARCHTLVLIGLAAGVLLAVASLPSHVPAQGERAQPVDATSMDRKVMCGYQGWFRCPGDAANQGWIHWSRDPKRLAVDTLTFEMWPDLTDCTRDELYRAPGFTHPDGSQAYLYSSDNILAIHRHFGWMRDYGIDGAWLQHFVVDLPGGPSQARYASRRHVLNHVRAAAKETGRVWALAYDVSGMPADNLFAVLTREWKRLVDEKVVADPRYLHHAGKPVVQVWGFYRNGSNTALTADLANRLIDFFKADGPYAAYLVGGGDWDWRRNPDKEWQAVYRRFDAYMPWNVGNYSQDPPNGVKRASVAWWADDLAECRRRGVRWVPVVYPGFSWDNLQRKPAGTTNIPRRKGEFLWEQFHQLALLKVDTAYIAMFDEVDEGTAIFKVSDAPPTQAHFVGLEGMPSDWYLRLAGEGGRMIRGERPVTAVIPLGR